MLDRIAHRGPDGEGAIAVANSWLGHRRLAIVDVQGGDQPIATAPGGAAMVGNEEIYNPAELRLHLDTDTDEPSEKVFAAIRGTLVQAVERRLMGDVPVVVLSGSSCPVARLQPDRGYRRSQRHAARSPRLVLHRRTAGKRRHRCRPGDRRGVRDRAPRTALHRRKPAGGPSGHDPVHRILRPDARPLGGRQLPARRVHRQARQGRPDRRGPTSSTPGTSTTATTRTPVTCTRNSCAASAACTT
jgi:hypothetical protein